MRRGFKAEAERHASALRAAIGCSEQQSPDLAAVAVHLGVAILPVDQLLPDGADALLVLHQVQSGAFSAVTISLPGRRIVVAYNPVNLDGHRLSPAEAKDDPRTRSNVAHEFAHLVLGHDVRQVLKIAGQSFFTCNPAQEEEANWLAAALLLPRPLLVDAARQNLTDDDVATAHNVSSEMARFRMNATGARMQAARGRRYRTA